MLTVTVSGRTYDFSHNVGGRYMQEPVSIGIGSGDTVYALSRGLEQIPNVPWNRSGSGSKVGKFTIGNVPRDEEFVADFGRYGDGEGQFIWPTGLALDSQENVYVTDEWMNRISVFDKEGTFLNSWGSAGSGDGELSGPAGIAIDQDDNLYVVDGNNHRVQKFTKDGNYLNAWGSLGDGDGQFDSPWGIAIDEQGHVYVADHRNHRVQKFTPDGGYLTQFGSHGTGRGQMDRPAGVAVDSDGDVYVCDWGNSRVQIFGPDGRFITSLIGDAQVPSKWHTDVIEANADVAKARRRVYTLEPEWRFAFPTAAVFDEEKSRLLVADTQRGRLQIYNKVRGYLEPQFNL
jgi:DNA-binding beta-propeller fold protein YncE